MGKVMHQLTGSTVGVGEEVMSVRRASGAEHAWPRTSVFFFATYILKRVFSSSAARFSPSEVFGGLLYTYRKVDNDANFQPTKTHPKLPSFYFSTSGGSGRGGRQAPGAAARAPSCGSAQPLWVAAAAGSRWRGRERKRLGFGDEIQRLWFAARISNIRR
jgi:hypothetical protein